jgi:hypothetical protein
MPSIIRATTTSGLQVAPDNSGSLQLQTNGTTTAVTIDTSQNVGIGTTSPTSSLVVAGAAAGTPTINGVHLGTQSGYATIELAGTSGTGSLIDFTQSGTDTKGRILYDNTNNYMVLNTNAAERMRIDSSGNVLVGTTSSIGGKISSVNAGDAIAGQVLSNNNFATFLGKNLSGTATFYVLGTGQITAAFTTINSTSDQRLKENITNLDVGLDAIMALKPRKFDWKKGKGKDIKGDRGFVAQEFEQVFPDLVGTSKYDVPEDEEPYKTISVDLIPVLVKAIQEQQTIINDLKARIETLEAK